jgi:hypothetical protein
MYEDCRIAVTDEGFDPYDAPADPKPCTTNDYLREREKTPADLINWWWAILSVESSTPTEKLYVVSAP